MNVDSVELFTALLSMVALGGSVLAIAARVLVTRSGSAARALADLHRMSLWLAASVAAVATAGSLYFSEIADYAPCRLCWFQRICMYPLTAILLIAAARRDWSARWYALPLLVCGAAISTYHYVIEWKPSWGESACGIGPSCTDVWFRELGFVTLAFMALAGFVTIGVLLFVQPSPSNHRVVGNKN